MRRRDYQRIARESAKYLSQEEKTGRGQGSIWLAKVGWIRDLPALHVLNGVAFGSN
jgi:hypothetical protein